jgi:uncharacterized integral membrane protein
MITDERRTEFHQQVSEHRLKVDGARSDKAVRVVGILFMVAGLIGMLVAYNASTSQSDLRDVTSSQILALCFLGLIVVGGALYLATAVARTLRVWLLRQLVEGQAQTDQIAAALRERG